VLLSELIAPSRRLALVGLAKNTGKTVTLAVLLRELEAQGRTVGVTSIGRDGERRDVIDSRIEKPRVRLTGGSIVATTDELLRASGLRHEPLQKTDARTPLGRVLIARLQEGGTIEVAGPSAAQDVRAVGEAMEGYGAEQVLIDGAVDRRAASSPAVADGLVVATGAVLSGELEQVVARTKEAIELVRLPRAENGAAGDEDERVALERGLVLNGEPAAIARLLRERPRASTFLVEGALGERFLEGLLQARAARKGREVRIVVGDPTKVFLSSRGPGWYRRQGVALEVLRTIELRAITVNPVAPQSHRFDSRKLRAALEAEIDGVPVFDVLDPSYDPPG
jgi:hypothetical protein